MDRTYYAIIADLFEYPSEKFPQKVADVIQFLEESYPDAAEKVKGFLKLLPVDDVDKMQELYTRSFDVQSITTMDLGYVMFGDDYKRGELLSNLNREHVKYKIDCKGELADHLPNVLRLLAQLQEKELVDELVKYILFPAVTKMIYEFNPKRIETKKKSYKKHYKTLIDVDVKKETIYVLCLAALDIVLRVDFGLKDVEASKPTSDFLRSVETEMSIEENAKA